MAFRPSPALRPIPDKPKFVVGDYVRKPRGSMWRGRVVGTYKTSMTQEGYVVESYFEMGSVQVYPAAALESWSTPESRL